MAEPVRPQGDPHLTPRLRRAPGSGPSSPLDAPLPPKAPLSTPPASAPAPSLPKVTAPSRVERLPLDRAALAEEFGDWLPYQRRFFPSNLSRQYPLALLLIALLAGAAFFLVMTAPPTPGSATAPSGSAAGGSTTPSTSVDGAPATETTHPWIDPDAPGPSDWRATGENDFAPFVVEHKGGRRGVSPIVPEGLEEGRAARRAAEDARVNPPRPPVVEQYETTAVPEWSDPETGPAVALDVAADRDLAVLAAIRDGGAAWSVDRLRYDPTSRAWNVEEGLPLPASSPDAGPGWRYTAVRAAMDGARCAVVRIAHRVDSGTWSASAGERDLAVVLDVWFVDPVTNRSVIESSLDLTSHLSDRALSGLRTATDAAPGWSAVDGYGLGTAAGHAPALSLALAESTVAVGICPPSASAGAAVDDAAGAVVPTSMAEGTVVVLRRDARFRQDATSWSPHAVLSVPTATAGDDGGGTVEPSPLGVRFGQAVALSGSVLVVGAPAAAGGVGGAGRAFVYRLDAVQDRWEHEATLAPDLPSVAGGYGANVCFNVDLLAVGDPAGDGGHGMIEIRRFDPRRQVWEREATILGSEVLDPGAEAFGAALAMWGRTLVVAASVADPSTAPTSAAADAGGRSASRAAIAFVLERDHATPFWRLTRRLHAVSAADGGLDAVTTCALSPTGGVMVAGLCRGRDDNGWRHANAENEVGAANDPAVVTPAAAADGTATASSPTALAWNYLLDDDGTPPLFALHLDVPEAHLDEVLRLRVRHARGGEPVVLAYGVNGRGQMLMSAVQATIDLAHPVQIWPGGRADEHGALDIRFRLPSHGRPGRLWLQAVQTGSTSNTVTARILPADHLAGVRSSPPTTAGPSLDDGGATEREAVGSTEETATIAGVPESESPRPAAGPAAQPGVRSLGGAPAVRTLSDRDR